MNIDTGNIYDSFDEAIAAGEPEDRLVSAARRETLEELRRRLNLSSKYQPHQGTKERHRRLRQMQRNAP